MKYYDALETRSDDARQADQTKAMLACVKLAMNTDGSCLVADGEVRGIDDLLRLPVLRKSELLKWQTQKSGPFGGIHTANVSHIFQSPGPIYEPGGVSPDWWRMGRGLFAAGFRSDDIVQNCFSYHLTPAGMMFDSAIRAIGARVLPAGIGQTELQVRAAHDAEVTGYVGTPDYLKIILDRADADGVKLQITKAAVGGGALFPSLRQEYADRGITCLQGYGTADLGSIAYESPAMEGMIVDEGVIVEIVRPGTGDPVAPGEVGEVVVTSLNPDYPLIRFATGDLSAVLAGVSPCGRTNMRIKGWMGRADQTTKIKGMFVRPEQVANFVAKHPEIIKARVVASRSGESDVMVVQVEAEGSNADAYAASVSETLKLRGNIEIVAPGSLPNDGLVIEDTRSYD